MACVSTIQYYWELYKLHRRGLDYSRDYQVKLYNWFPPFMPQDLWISKFIEGHGLLKNKPHLKAGVFTVNGKPWMVRNNNSDLKIFFARENLATRPEWREFMLNEPCIDLSIGFDDIKDNPKYLRIPFWITWALDPMETFDSIKTKIQLWNSPNNKSYSNRQFCSFLCSHGDEGRERIFNELSQIGRIDSAGRWMHNDDSLKTLYDDDKIKWISNYRFNLTPENSNAPGYVTEKLLEAIQGGCVPIYWGGDNHPDTDVFNQDAIVFFNMDKSNADSINLITDLNSDEHKYMDFACQPRFVDGVEHVIWNYYELLLEAIQRIVANYE